MTPPRKTRVPLLDALGTLCAEGKAAAEDGFDRLMTLREAAKSGLL